MSAIYNYINSLAPDVYIPTREEWSATPTVLGTHTYSQSLAVTGNAPTTVTGPDGALAWEIAAGTSLDMATTDAGVNNNEYVIGFWLKVDETSSWTTGAYNKILTIGDTSTLGISSFPGVEIYLVRNDTTSFNVYAKWGDDYWNGYANIGGNNANGQWWYFTIVGTAQEERGDAYKNGIRRGTFNNVNSWNTTPMSINIGNNDITFSISDFSIHYKNHTYGPRLNAGVWPLGTGYTTNYRNEILKAAPAITFIPGGAYFSNVNSTVPFSGTIVTGYGGLFLEDSPPRLPDETTNSTRYSASTYGASDWYRMATPAIDKKHYAFEAWYYNDEVTYGPSTNTWDWTHQTGFSTSSMGYNMRLHVRGDNIALLGTGYAGSMYVGKGIGYDKWTHVVAEMVNTSEFQEYRVYIDGILEATFPFTGVVNNTNDYDYFFPHGGSSGVYVSNKVYIDNLSFYTTNLDEPIIDADLLYQRYTYGKAMKYYDGSSWKVPQSTSVYYGDNPVRYIRWGANGSTSNSATHFAEIQAFENGAEKLFGLLPTVITGDYQSGDYATLTDGTTASTPYVGFSSLEPVLLEWDLGAEYLIDLIKFWNYYADGRSYYDVNIQVSTDGVNFTTIYGPATTATTATGVLVNVAQGWQAISEVDYWNGTAWEVLAL